MIKISKIEVQKNHDDRVSIFVDDNYYASMFLDTAVKYGVKKDAEFNEEEFKKYLLESEKNLAFNKAINYINTAFKTAKQLRDYLNKKGYDKLTVDYVIDKLKEYNFLNDRNFAETYVNTYRNKYGKNMLKNKLFEKGIAKNIIEEVLEDFETEESTIDKLLIKKIGNKNLDNELTTKCMRFLAGRGFSFDEINLAIRRYKEDKGVAQDESWDWYFRCFKNGKYF